MSPNPLRSWPGSVAPCWRQLRLSSNLAFILGLLLWAGSLRGAQPDASNPQPLGSTKPAPKEVLPNSSEVDKEVRALINQMVVLWNAHDIDAYLKLFWASDQLLIVQDGAPIFGWQKLRQRYLRSYPDRSQMGTMSLEGLKIEVFDHNFVQALCWWRFSTGGTKFSAVDITLFRRFSGGWAIVSRETFD